MHQLYEKVTKVIKCCYVSSAYSSSPASSSKSSSSCFSFSTPPWLLVIVLLLAGGAGIAVVGWKLYDNYVTNRRAELLRWCFQYSSLVNNVILSSIHDGQGSFFLEGIVWLVRIFLFANLFTCSIDHIGNGSSWINFSLDSTCCCSQFQRLCLFLEFKSPKAFA